MPTPARPSLISAAACLSRLGLTLALGACGHLGPTADSRAHLTRPQLTAATPSDIPTIVPQAFAELPADAGRPPIPRFSLAVDEVPTQQFLTTLARDAGMDIEFLEPVGGQVRLHARDLSLPQILRRVARQARLRIDIEDRQIVVRPDTPYLRLYPLDYVHVNRQMSATIATATQIGVAPAGTTDSSPAPGGGAQGGLRIDNRTRHHFWDSLEKNLRDLLREEDRLLPEGSSETVVEQNSQQGGTTPVAPATRAPARRPAATPPSQIQSFSQQQSSQSVIRKRSFEEAGSVILSPESGLLSVRATQRQHEKIQAFLDRLLGAARRQVMIEATVVEVELSEGYRHGIDWSRLRADGSGFSVTRPASASTSDSAGTAFSLVFKRLASPLNLVAAIDLLQSFGTTRVLSSPRLSVLNNQTALLKVVENVTYFSVKSDTTVSANVGTTTAVTTTPQSVSVGLVMSVTPQISEYGSVMLNIRPTISSVSDWKQDPNPSNVVANFVPQIRTREIESVMRIEDGDIAVLGGLMEDGVTYQTGRVPGLGQLPIAGELLTRRDNQARKSELVILLRPRVMADGQRYPLNEEERRLIPGTAFHQAPPHAALAPQRQSE